MARKRTIVGLGEALLAEYPDREEPAGLALLIPRYAVLLGHVGIAISRLGQDPAAQELIAQLRVLGVDVTHLQSDPDLATGRWLVRSTGAETFHSLDSEAAFDNLQWDFDLADVAQQTDAVVYGALARRTGQARSVSDRFLAECKFALRVFDLTNRPDDQLDRSRAMSGLKYANTLVVDDFARNVLLPGGVDQPQREAAVELLGLGNLTLVVIAQPGEPMVVHSAESSWSGHAHRREAHEASIVALLHGVLAGWDVQAAVGLADRLAGHILKHPGEPPPQELLRQC